MPTVTAAAAASHTEGDLPRTDMKPLKPPPALPTSVANLPMLPVNTLMPFVTLLMPSRAGPVAAAIAAHLMIC